MGREPGQYGGVVRMLIGGQRDIRMMTINGYARLVGLDEKLNFQPDILENFDAVEDRIYTLKIRERPQMVGRQPADLRRFPLMWEDVLSNEDLSPGGFSPALHGRTASRPMFEVVDD